MKNMYMKIMSGITSVIILSLPATGMDSEVQVPIDVLIGSTASVNRNQIAPENDQSYREAIRNDVNNQPKETSRAFPQEKYYAWEENNVSTAGKWDIERNTGDLFSEATLFIRLQNSICDPKTKALIEAFVGEMGSPDSPLRGQVKRIGIISSDTPDTLSKQLENMKAPSNIFYPVSDISHNIAFKLGALGKENPLIYYVKNQEIIDCCPVLTNDIALSLQQARQFNWKQKSKFTAPLTEASSGYHNFIKSTIDNQAKSCPIELPSINDTIDALLAGNVILLTIPAAFSPTCSNQISEYIKELKNELSSLSQHLNQQNAKIVVVSTDELVVLEAWLKENGAPDNLIPLADPSGYFLSHLGKLESNVRLQRVVRRGILFIQDRKILNYDFEAKNPDIKKTRFDQVLDFIWPTQS